MNILFSSMDRWCAQMPDKPAVRIAGVQMSYQALQLRVLQLTVLLRTHNCGPGDRVLLFMPNGVDYISVLLAALRIGAHIIPVHAMSRLEELTQINRSMHPVLCVVSTPHLGDMLRATDDSLRIIDLSASQTLGCEVSGRESDSGSDSSAKLFISTSGSTGKMKFVTNTLDCEITNALLYVRRLRVAAQDVIYTALPMSQKFGLAALLGSLITGCTLVSSPQFHAAEALSLIAANGVTVQYGVPTIYSREKEAYLQAQEKPNISSLRAGIIAGASGAEEVFSWFEQMGCRLLNCYGTSEIGGLTMTDYSDDFTVRAQTCGHGFSGTRIEVLDAMGRPVHIGESGEIVCTTPWMMRGYEGEPVLTAKVFDLKGRFLTGDIGYMDTRGNLTICGRKKDLIIRGGYNVFPAEVEQALTTYAGVSEACVVGYRDAQLGERICAFVKMAADSRADRQSIRSLLAQYIAKYKLPDEVVFLDEIPKLPNGKQDRSLLKAYLAEKIEGKKAQ